MYNVHIQVASWNVFCIFVGGSSVNGSTFPPFLNLNLQKTLTIDTIKSFQYHFKKEAPHSNEQSINFAHKKWHNHMQSIGSIHMMFGLNSWSLLIIGFPLSSCQYTVTMACDCFSNEGSIEDAFWYNYWIIIFFHKNTADVRLSTIAKLHRTSSAVSNREKEHCKCEPIHFSFASFIIKIGAMLRTLV